MTAPGLVASVPAAPQGSRYRDLKLDSQPPACCNDRMFAELKAALASHATVLHLLRDYSDRLQDGLDNSSPLFLRLQELFNRAASGSRSLPHR